MMTHKKRSQFTVRELHNEAELALCLELDHSYDTDYVWQVDMREGKDDLNVRFRTVRLPRTMQVPYPRDRQDLALSWKERDCFLVAAVDEVILGYINMSLDESHSKAWIRDLVVGSPFRRRHIGSALLEQATYWANLRRVKHVTIETQTKNFPGITFAQGHRFTFCGFNDHYYMNQDIALFFSKAL